MQSMPLSPNFPDGPVGVGIPGTDYSFPISEIGE